VTIDNLGVNVSPMSGTPHGFFFLSWDFIHHSLHGMVCALAIFLDLPWTLTEALICKCCNGWLIPISFADKPATKQTKPFSSSFPERP